MDKHHNFRTRFLYSLVLFGIIVGIGCVCSNMKMKHYKYQSIEGVNPFVGYAVDARNVDEITDQSLVYVQISFRELEPEQGIFAMDEIKARYGLERWKKEGKHVVFRFVCDVPSTEEHMDIPDWLYEETKDGSFYDMTYGKGYSPNYENEIFIKEHENAVRALGEEFGKDSFFAYIELGSVGHWGEWHVKYDAGISRVPDEVGLSKYVAPYIDAFPNARLLMRRPFSFVKTYHMGVYNDMTGEPEDTLEWLSWILKGGTYEEPKKPLKYVVVPDVWKDAPVGGEFTSSIKMETMLIDNLEQTKALIRDSHMSFIGPKCPVGEEREGAYAKGYEQVLESLGYQYGIRKATFINHPIKKNMDVKMELVNYGNAPIYFSWPLVYVVEYRDGKKIKCKCDYELGKLGANETEEIRLCIPRDSVIEKIYIGVENPESGICEMKLYMDLEQKDGMYRIY